MSLNYGVVVVVVDGAAGPVKNPYAWPELTLRCLFPPVIAGFFRSHGFAVIFSVKIKWGGAISQCHQKATLRNARVPVPGTGTGTSSPEQSLNIITQEVWYRINNTKEVLFTIQCSDI